MSGYLARLAARAGGASAAAGPRLPSRFEPGSGERSTDAAPPASTATPPAAPPRAVLPGPAGVGDGPTPADPVGAAPGDDDRVMSTPAVPPHVARTTTLAGSEDGAAAPTAAPAARVAPEPGDPEPGDPAVARPPAPAVPTAVPRAVATSPRRVKPPAVTTATAGAGAGDAASIPASEPDVVHVTIGRIEVRAAVAPPAAGRSARPSRDPERSLHDYLAGRPR